MKSRIFLIVILCIISCGIGVYAATAFNSSGNTNASANVTYTYSNGTLTKGTVNKSSGSSAYIWSQSINDINATITFD